MRPRSNFHGHLVTQAAPRGLLGALAHRRRGFVRPSPWYGGGGAGAGGIGWLYAPGPTSLGQYLLSEIVAPASALLDARRSGNRSEIANRLFIFPGFHYPRSPQQPDSGHEIYARRLLLIA